MLRFFNRNEQLSPFAAIDSSRPRLAELLRDLSQERENEDVWIADVTPVHRPTDEELRDAIHCHLRLSSEGKRLALKNVAADFAAMLENTRLSRMIEIRNILPPPENAEAS